MIVYKIVPQITYLTNIPNFIRILTYFSMSVKTFEN